MKSLVFPKTGDLCDKALTSVDHKKYHCRIFLIVCFETVRSPQLPWQLVLSNHNPLER